jgi:hypothetical protein
MSNPAENDGDDRPTIPSLLRSLWRRVHDRVLRKYIKRVN